MKRVFVFLFISCIAITACNSHGDKITVKDDKGNKATIDVSDAKEAAKKVEENAGKAEELKKLTPLTIDQVKALIPNELMGMNRSSFSANSAMGVSVGNGTYKGENDKEMNLEIIDCAGEMGANGTICAFLLYGIFNRKMIMAIRKQLTSMVEKQLRNIQNRMIVMN